MVVNTFFKKRSIFLIRYRFDIMAALTSVGYYPKRLRDDKIMGEGTMSKIRKGEIVSAATLNSICDILHCQPGDLLEYIPDEKV